MKKVILICAMVVCLSGGCQNALDGEGGKSPVIRAIDRVREANAITAPFNPYAGVVEIGLSLATLLAGGYGLKTRREKLRAIKKYTAHKLVVEQKFRQLPAEAAEELYAEIGEKRKELGL